jgi:Sensors of blue-light using FAD
MNQTKNALRSLAYVSRCTRNVTVFMLGELLVKSQRMNNDVGVTGLLIYSSGLFAQTIEGESHVIDMVYARIANSPLHTDLRVFFDEQIQARLYPTWAMMSNTAMGNEKLAKFIRGRLALPHQFTSDQSITSERMLEFISEGDQSSWLTDVQAKNAFTLAM